MNMYSCLVVWMTNKIPGGQGSQWSRRSVQIEAIQVVHSPSSLLDRPTPIWTVRTSSPDGPEWPFGEIVLFRVA